MTRNQVVRAQVAAAEAEVQAAERDRRVLLHDPDPVERLAAMERLYRGARPMLRKAAIDYGDGVLRSGALSDPEAQPDGKARSGKSKGRRKAKLTRAQRKAAKRAGARIDRAGVAHFPGGGTMGPPGVVPVLTKRARQEAAASRLVATMEQARQRRAAEVYLAEREGARFVRSLEGG